MWLVPVYDVLSLVPTIWGLARSLVEWETMGADTHKGIWWFADLKADNAIAHLLASSINPNRI